MQISRVRSIPYVATILVWQPKSDESKGMVTLNAFVQIVSMFVPFVETIIKQHGKYIRLRVQTKLFN